MIGLDIDSEDLIAQVKNKPVLWDKTCERGRIATAKAWEEVCIELIEDFETLDEEHKKKFTNKVKWKWTHIRDSYAKFVKRKNQARRSGARGPRIKKYCYHDQMQFLAKVYYDKHGEKNREGNKGTFLRCKVKREEVSSDEDESVDVGSSNEYKGEDVDSCNEDKSVDVDSSYQDKREDVALQIYNETPQSDAGSEDNSTSFETMSTSSQFSCSIFNKRKKLDESERNGNSKARGGGKSERHLSFFKGIVPSLEEFNEPEILKFQMGVLQLISNISDQKHKASHAQLPAQGRSFSSQLGPSPPPNTAMYLPHSNPSCKTIFPTFWSTVCPRCSIDSKTQGSSSNPVD